MWGLLNLVKFVQSRPSDKFIRITRTLLWVFILSLLAYEFYALEIAYIRQYLDSNTAYANLVLWIFWLVPLFFWITWMCAFKRANMKKFQMIFWFLMIICSYFIIPTYSSINSETIIEETKETDTEVMSGELSFDDVVNSDNNILEIYNSDNTSSTVLKSPGSNIYLPTFLFFIGLILIIVWLTWKWITKSCLKYGEKITKIRV